MKRFGLYIGILLLSFYSSSCKKEHLTAQSNGSPVFYFTGLVGGNATRLQAGINNYYMYSSYTQNGDGVYNYTGNLKEYSCSSNCPPSIQFVINNYRSRATGASESNIADSSLRTTYYNYLVPGGNPSSFYVLFTPQVGTSASIKSFTFNFGDGTSYTGVDSLTSIYHEYSHIANYSTTLSVKFSDGYTNTLFDTIEVGTGNKVFNCFISDSMGVFYANVFSGTLPFTYSWNFGDINSGASNTATTISASHVFTDTNTHHVILSVKDNLNHIITTNTYAANNVNSGQAHVFNYTTSGPNYVLDTLALSNVMVTYTDASGDSYSSNNTLQPDSSFLQITSVSNYQNNENGQSTKQLHVKFNCILYDNSGNTLAIKNGDAVIAVAYK